MLNFGRGHANLHVAVSVRLNYDWNIAFWIEGVFEHNRVCKKRLVFTYYDKAPFSLDNKPWPQTIDQSCASRNKPPGGGTWPEKWQGCADRKLRTHPPTHISFWNYTHFYRFLTKIFAYFSRVFRYFWMIIDKSNLTLRPLTIFNDSMTSYDYFWGIILKPISTDCE